MAERERPFWGFAEVLLAFAVFLTGLGVAMNLATHFLHEEARAGYWLIAEEFAAYLLLFGALKLLFAFHHRPLLSSLGWVPQYFKPGTLLGAGFAMFLLSVLLQVVFRTPDTSTPFDKLINADPWSRIAIATFGISIGPAIEELLFRGLLQPVLANVAGVFPGILLTSIFFGVVHLNQNAFLWQSGVLISLAGFAFGTVRHISGSTEPPP